MPFDVDFVSEKRRAIVTGIGTVTLKDVLHVTEAVISSERWSAGMDILADYTALNEIDLDTEQVRTVATIHGGLADELGNGRLAVVVSSDVNYGIHRMCRALAPQLKLKVEIFMDRREAEEWLDSDGE